MKAGGGSIPSLSANLNATATSDEGSIPSQSGTQVRDIIPIGLCQHYDGMELNNGLSDLFAKQGRYKSR